MPTDRTDDAIALLEADHAALRGLLEEAARGAGATPQDATALADCAARLHARLALHERREEEVLFRAVAAMGPVRFAAEEHIRLGGIMDALDRAMADVRAAPSQAAGAALKRVVEELAYCLAGHMMKEEQLVFRMARAMLGPERLLELGARMVELD